MLNERALLKPVSCKPLVDSGARSKIKCPPEKTKTRYLPPEEAIGLSSGADKNSASRWKSISYGSKTMIPKANRAPVTIGACPSKNPPVVIKANPRFGHSRLSNSVLRPSINQDPVLPRDGKRHPATEETVKKAEASTNTVQEVMAGALFAASPSIDGPPLKSPDVKRYPATEKTVKKDEASTKKVQEVVPGALVAASPPIDESLLKSPGRETEKQHTVRKEPVGGHSSAKDFQGSVHVFDGNKSRASASQSVLLQSVVNSAENIYGKKDLHINDEAHPRHAAVAGKELRDGDPKLDRYLPNGPAAYTAWKGSFKIINEVAVGQVYDGLRAHPPIKVHREAYKALKNMPDALRFSLLPRLDFCAQVLGGDAPDIHDIALYIFPTADRFQSSYTCLVEYLHMRDIVMKSCIHGVDLMIFSSSLLPVESQRVNGAYYLWGMFSKLEFKQIQEDAVQDEVVDMEIDMVGGEELGAAVIGSPQEPDVPPGFKATDKFRHKSSCQ